MFLNSPSHGDTVIVVSVQFEKKYICIDKNKVIFLYPFLKLQSHFLREAAAQQHSSPETSLYGAGKKRRKEKLNNVKEISLQ